MITYQRTEEDTPQPVDEHGCLPDGTQVIFYPVRIETEGGRITFKEGHFKENKTLGCTEACYTGIGETE